MKKNAVYASSLCALAALLAFTACKKSSSSSSNGSVTGAMGNLASLVQADGSFPGLNPSGLRPRSGQCYTLTPVSPAPTNGTHGSCPSGYGPTPSVDQTFSVSIALSSCTYNNYTYNGTVAIAVPSGLSLPAGSSAYNSDYVQCSSGTATAEQVSFGVTGSLTITGNGVNLNCSSSGLGAIALGASVSDINNTKSASIFGSACGATNLNASF